MGVCEEMSTLFIKTTSYESGRQFFGKFGMLFAMFYMPSQMRSSALQQYLLLLSLRGCPIHLGFEVGACFQQLGEG